MKNKIIIWVAVVFAIGIVRAILPSKSSTLAKKMYSIDKQITKKKNKYDKKEQELLRDRQDIEWLRAEYKKTELEYNESMWKKASAF